MCGRCYCPTCGEEMIHRDHRKSYESASALGQIIHREGPTELTVGDLDLYCAKYRGPVVSLRFVEHKQPDQPLGKMQAGAFRVMDRIFDHAIKNPPPNLRLDPGSGLFIIRGEVEGETEGSRKVNFKGKQTITRLDGTEIPEHPKTRKEFYDWLNGGPGWTPRQSRSRYGGNS